ncbi:MAG: HAD-IIB family hydrolase [Ruminococcus sp.]|nr:HAD-IIB family hydrolase [Ruminococcus sp.]
MKKIMFFDIDGTLVPENGEQRVPDSARKALELSRRAGNLLFINTGRPAMNVGRVVRKLGFDGYVMGCGTHIEYEGRELLYHTVDPALCRKTVALLRKCNAVPMFERRDCVLFDFTMRELPMIRDIRRGFAAEGKDVDRSTADADFSFDKFIINYDAESDIASLRPALEKNFFWIDRGEGFAEIVPKPYSKATGIELVLSHCGVPKENAFAIGDSLNDLPMFSAVGTSIAMGNGKMLIPYADYVTDDIMQDGIYNALSHFGFFGEEQL